MIRLTQKIAITCLLWLPFSAFSAEVPQGVTLHKTQSLTRLNPGEPITLDPGKGSSDSESSIIQDLFAGLVYLDKNNQIRPDLAESWETNDGLTYLFHLRAGLKWSDGSPLKASDIVYSWRRILTETNSDYATYLEQAGVVNASAILSGKMKGENLGVTALDERTLQVVLERPSATFIPMLALPYLAPVNPHNVARYGDKWTQPGHMVSSGPYALSEWKVNEKVTLIRNPFYYDNASTVIDKVTYVPIVADSAAYNRYRSGELDISTVPLELFNKIRESSEYGPQLRLSPYLNIYYYIFNVTKPPFNDARVRRALSLAIDRNVIANKVLGMGQIPAFLVAPEKIGGADFQNPVWSQWSQEERNREAKKLLTEAGVGVGRDNPLSFKLLYNTNEAHRKIAIAVNSMWRKTLGADAQLTNKEWKTLLQDMNTGAFEVVRYGWYADYDDISSFLELFKTGNSMNRSGYSNPDYDILLNKAAASADKAQRDAYYQQALSILATDSPAIPVYQAMKVNLVKPYVGGYQTNSLKSLYTKDMYITGP